MFRKVFITGTPRTGKTTLVSEIIKWANEKGVTVGGIITPEIKKGNTRIGFKVIDVLTKKEGIFAYTRIKKGLKFGKYKVDIETFEEISLPAIQESLKKAEIIVIDEIGKMELLSEKFRNMLSKLLTERMNIAGERILIATVHRTLKNEFSGLGDMIWLTKENRKTVYLKILDILKKITKKKGGDPLQSLNSK